MESAKLKMDEVREENERLKLTLSKMMKDYNSLKMHIQDIVQQDQEYSKKSTDSDDEESDLVSLCLGRISAKRDQEKKNSINYETNQSENIGKLDGLELGLDCKFHLGINSTKLPNSKNHSPENSFDGSKEDEGNETKLRNKNPKNSRSEDDDVLQHENPLKKPRVSVRAVCDTQTMNDGCQWRKYGQKISKGNPCPRAYYRCTASSSCPVRKQVQRCVNNMSILITTYEGNHNHRLPPSATTMASATTAAAAMLKCGSTTSSPPDQNTAISSNNLLGFKFSSSNTSYFPRTSISTSQSHPTITLDLTAPIINNPYKKFPSFSSPLNSSSSTSLNFSSSSNTLKSTWDNARPDTTTTPYNYISQSYNYKKNQEQIPRNDPFEIDATTTKAITHDPTFQSALAAAISSFVGNGGNNSSIQERNSPGVVQNVKSGDQMDFQLSFSQPSARNGIIACAKQIP